MNTLLAAGLLLAVIIITTEAVHAHRAGSDTPDETDSEPEPHTGTVDLSGGSMPIDDEYQFQNSDEVDIAIDDPRGGDEP